jgi:hypothetical protein
MIKKGLKIEMALIDDAKSVDVNFNKYAQQAASDASKAINIVTNAIKTLNLAMAEADKAEKIYAEIEKSAASLGIKPTDLPYTILVREVIMDSAQYEDLLAALKSAEKALSSTGF